MAFHAFADPFGNINPPALVEQTGLLYALFCNYQQYYGAIIAAAGGGTLLAFEGDPTSWPPDYAVTQQGGNNYYIQINGTTNFGQLVDGNIIGTFATPWLTSNVYAHQGFYDFYALAWSAIRPLLPANLNTGNYFISGHSLGGAIAVYLAYNLASLTSSANVQLMTFGQPRCFTVGNPGTPPSVYFRIVNNLDWVPSLPPSQATQALAIFAGNYIYSNNTPVWQHYGGRLYYNQTGGLEGPTYKDVDNFFNLFYLYGTINLQHAMRRYSLSALAFYRNSTPDPQTTAVAVVIASILDQFFKPNVKNDPDLDGHINPATANSIYFPGMGTPLNAGNIPFVRSITIAFGKITTGVLKQPAVQPAIPVRQPTFMVMWTINTPKKLCSERHFLAPIFANLQAALPTAVQLARYRAALLPAECTMLEVRVSNENINADSLVLSQGLGIPGNPAWGFENQGNDCLKVYLRCGTAYRSTTYFCCIPDALVSNDAYVPAELPAWTQVFKFFLDTLTSAQVPKTNLYGTPGVERDPAVSPIVQVKSVSGNAGDTFATVTTVQPHLCQTGGACRISRASFATAQQPFNRLWAIGAVTATTLQILNFPLIQETFSTACGGKLWNMIRVFHPYTGYQIGAPGTRKRGVRGRLVSWEIVEPQFKGLLFPGCYAMAVLKRGHVYSTKVHLFRDANIQATIRWYYVPDHTPFLPVPHLWGGRPWRYDRTPPTNGPGELTQYTPGTSDGGAPLNEYPWLGSDDWWANGVPVAALQGGPVQSRPGLCPPGPPRVRVELPLKWEMDGTGLALLTGELAFETEFSGSFAVSLAGTLAFVWNIDGVAEAGSFGLLALTSTWNATAAPVMAGALGLALTLDCYVTQIFPGYVITPCCDEEPMPDVLWMQYEGLRYFDFGTGWPPGQIQLTYDVTTDSWNGSFYIEAPANPPNISGMLNFYISVFCGLPPEQYFQTITWWFEYTIIGPDFFNPSPVELFGTPITQFITTNPGFECTPWGFPIDPAGLDGYMQIVDPYQDDSVYFGLSVGPIFPVDLDFSVTWDGAAYAIMTVTGETDFVTSIDGEAVAQVMVDGELDLLLSLDAEAVSQATVTGDLFMAFDFDGTLTPVMTADLDLSSTWDATVQAEGIQPGEIDFDLDFNGALTPVMTADLALSSTWDASTEAEFVGALGLTASWDATAISVVTTAGSLALSSTWDATAISVVTTAGSLALSSTWDATAETETSGLFILTTTWDATAISVVTTAGSVALATTWDATAETETSGLLILTTTWSGAMQTVLAGSVALATTWNATAETETSGLLILTTTWSATAKPLLAGSVALSSTWNGTALARVNASGSVALSSTWNGTALARVNASGSVALSSTWNATASFTPGGQMSQTVGLSATIAGSSPYTQIEFGFKECVVANASNVLLTLFNSNTITINSASSGANGLDTGSIAANTWYYFYAIWNGTTVAGLLSLQNVMSFATLPSGYTYGLLLGSVYSNASKQFGYFVQYQNQVWMEEQVVFTAKTGVTSYTTQSVSAIVSPLAISFSGNQGCSATQNGGMTVATDANGTGAQTANMASAAIANNGFTGGASPYTDLYIGESQAFFWKSVNTNAVYRVTVNGWKQ